MIEPSSLIGNTGSRRIVIEPVTRVEGHGKVTIILDESGQVQQARLHITEFRGFERFIRGRLLWEVPVIVQRLCGICPVSHHLGAAKAMDTIVGASQLTPTAEKMRRLMHYGQIVQSHATHFFYLAAPDLLLGVESDIDRRNVAGIVFDYPDMALRGIRLRKYGQSVIERTAGKRIHGTGAIPGGINKNLSTGERDILLEYADKAVEDASEACSFMKTYLTDHRADLSMLGSFATNRLCSVDREGTLDLYDGVMRAVDGNGRIIFDGELAADYNLHIAEEVRSWSYMKFPYFRRLGPEQGWYSVGPLPRLTACTRLDTPLAETQRRSMIGFLGENASRHTIAHHWARLVELLYGTEKLALLLRDPDLQGKDLVNRGSFADEGISMIEAPRGTLFHHYRIDRNHQITMANIIVSTTQNNMPMNKAVEQVAKSYLEGTSVTEGLLNRIEAAIRAFDPCLSCATHAAGRMPLSVTLCSADGRVLDNAIRTIDGSMSHFSSPKESSCLSNKNIVPPVREVRRL